MFFSDFLKDGGALALASVNLIEFRVLYKIWQSFDFATSTKLESLAKKT